MISIFESEIYLLSPARPPIGRFLGALSPYSAVILGGKAIEGALRRAVAAAVSTCPIPLAVSACSARESPPLSSVLNSISPRDE